MAAEWVTPEQPSVSDKGFLDDAVLDVQGQLAGALLRSTPATTMGQARNVFDLLDCTHLPSLGNGAVAVMRALLHITISSTSGKLHEVFSSLQFSFARFARPGGL